MKPHCCVTTLWKHMMVASAAIQKGTPHEKDWLIDHGARQLTHRPLRNVLHGVNFGSWQMR
jgi:hypothetical protein